MSHGGFNHAAYANMNMAGFPGSNMVRSTTTKKQIIYVELIYLLFF